MKRSLVAILAIFYLVISSGFTVNFHYCMGKLKTVKIQAIAGKLCGCKAGENNKCCKSEYKVIKLQSDQKTTENTVSIPAASIPQPVHAYLFAAPLVIEPIGVCNALLDPPLIDDDIVIANRVFRI